MTAHVEGYSVVIEYTSGSWNGLRRWSTHSSKEEFDAWHKQLMDDDSGKSLSDITKIVAEDVSPAYAMRLCDSAVKKIFGVSLIDNLNLVEGVYDCLMVNRAADIALKKEKDPGRYM